MKQCKIDGCESTDLATRSSMCKPHHREYNRAHYEANKQYYKDKANARKAVVRAANRVVLQNYLRQHPCVDCGEADIEVLQFDHRDREEKTAVVVKFIDGSTERMMEEVAKCDVRCANCHVRRTRRQMGWWHDAHIEVDTAHAHIEAMPVAVQTSDDDEVASLVYI